MSCIPFSKANLSMILRYLPLFLVGVCLIAVPQARAESVFVGSDSSGRAASVTFDVSGSNLLVTLTNTSTADVLAPTDVLTAVFFDIQGNPNLSRVSAKLSSGSTVLFPPSGTGTDSGGVVGGEWAYLSNLSSTPFNTSQGISSTGLNLFGGKNRFPGTNLQGPVSPDGLQYGLTSAGDDPLTGNTPVTGGYALIKNSVDFILGGLPSGFQLSRISNVHFLYGTNLTDVSFSGSPPGPVPVPGPGPSAVPEPSAFALLGMGALFCFAMLMIRRKRPIAATC